MPWDARVSRVSGSCTREATPDPDFQSTRSLSHSTMFVRGLARRLPHRPLRRWAHTPASLQFNSVTEEDVTHFSKILPSSSVLSTLPPISTPASELSIFNNDWMNKYHGKSTTVLRPRTTKEVSEIVKWCNERRIPIVPQGGNTGLVGGGIPMKDELILSLGNMTNVRSFDPTSGEPSSNGTVGR
jgi:(R)-2-hydroxyglutarate---pyruvate transhydrogenase